MRQYSFKRAKLAWSALKSSSSVVAVVLILENYNFSKYEENKCSKSPRVSYYKLNDMGIHVA